LLFGTGRPKTRSGQIAKNCRTSVEMIEKFDASHIKTRLDGAAINIMRKKKVAKAGPRNFAPAPELYT
jgi:hypothetical protein